LGHDQYNTKEFAIKQICWESFDQLAFLREIETLILLNHPCVLRIFGFVPPARFTPAEIHMEYAKNGSLDHVLKSKPRFLNATVIGKVICGIVLGMRFIHSRGIIHRDLKPRNILLNSEYHALIGDFGTSCCERLDHTPTPDAGTLYYAAPEMFEEVAQTTKLDVFSFGLVLYEILVGYPVFSHDQTPFEILWKITRGNMPNIPDKVLPSMKSLIKRCWALKPDDRPTFEDIFQDLKSNNFEIVAGADIWIVRGYVAGVEHWEQMSESNQNQSDLRGTEHGSTKSDETE
jgi:serine/threonine protein kinase